MAEVDEGVVATGFARTAPDHDEAVRLDTSSLAVPTASTRSAPGGSG